MEATGNGAAVMRWRIVTDCVAEITGDFEIVPAPGWEIEKEEEDERDRRKRSGGADVANRERAAAEAVIFMR